MTYSDLLLFYARNGLWRPLRQSAYRKFCRRNRGKSIVTTTKHDFLVRTVIGDTVDNAIFVYGIFEKGTTRIINMLGSDCDAFVDVGCNIGYYSCLFGSRNRRKPLLAIDPNPEMTRRTEENLKLNEITNYRVLTCGVGAGNDKLMLKISDRRHSLSSFVYDPKTGVDRCIEAEVNALDDILKDFVHVNILLKIDTEGFEYQVFQGLSKASVRSIKYIVFELSMPNILQSGVSPGELAALPVFDNFEVFHISEENGELTPERLDRLFSDPNSSTNVLLVNKSSNASVTFAGRIS